MKFRTDLAKKVTIHRFIDRRARNEDRICSPLLPAPEHQAAARAYLRDLRAAELIAWEMTGGDYLISQ